MTIVTETYGARERDEVRLVAFLWLVQLSRLARCNIFLFGCVYHAKDVFRPGSPDAKNFGVFVEPGSHGAWQPHMGERVEKKSGPILAGAATNRYFSLVWLCVHT